MWCYINLCKNMYSNIIGVANNFFMNSKIFTFKLTIQHKIGLRRFTTNKKNEDPRMEVSQSWLLNMKTEIELQNNKTDPKSVLDKKHKLLSCCVASLTLNWQIRSCFTIFYTCTYSQISQTCLNFRRCRLICCQHILP